MGVNNNKNIRRGIMELEKLYDDIESRLSEMEKPQYEYPKRFSKRDYIFVAVVCIICLAGIIYGGFIN